MDFLDFYAAGWPLMVLGLAEFVLVAGAYGVGNFLRDLNHMVGFDPGEWSKSHFVCLFSTVSPLLLMVRSMCILHVRIAQVRQYVHIYDSVS